MLLGNLYKMTFINVAVTCMPTNVSRVLCMFFGHGIAKTRSTTSGFRKICVRATYGTMWIIRAWKHSYDQ